MPKKPPTKTPNVTLDGKGGKIPSTPKTPPAQKITTTPRPSTPNLPAVRPPQSAPRPVNVKTLGPQELPKLRMPTGAAPGSAAPKLLPPSNTIYLESTTQTHRESLISKDNQPKLKYPKPEPKPFRTGGAQAARAAHVPPTPKPPAAPATPAVKAPPAPTATVKPAMPAAAAAAEAGGAAKAVEAGAKVAKAGRLAAIGRNAWRGTKGVARVIGLETLIPVAAGYQTAAKLTVDSEHRPAATQLKEKYGIYAKRPDLTVGDAVGAWLGADSLIRDRERVIGASDPNKIKFYDAEGNDLEKASPYSAAPKDDYARFNVAGRPSSKKKKGGI